MRPACRLRRGTSASIEMMANLTAQKEQFKKTPKNFLWMSKQGELRGRGIDRVLKDGQRGLAVTRAPR